MDPRSLFKPGLTVPEHETRDLHYIGEAMPVPSLITSSISIEADANTGGSPVPAREDHVHAVDVASLIQFINENEELVDLTNYYTKEEVDALLDSVVAGDIDLSNYYTKAEMDSALLTLADAIDQNTADLSALYDRVTTLEAHVDVFELYWSYGTTVNPAMDTILGHYIAYRDMYINQIMLTLVGNSGTTTAVRLFQNHAGGMYSEVAFASLTAGDNVNLVTISSLLVQDGDGLFIKLDANPSGTGEVLVVGIRGTYIYPEDAP